MSVINYAAKFKELARLIPELMTIDKMKNPSTTWPEPHNH